MSPYMKYLPTARVSIIRQTNMADKKAMVHRRRFLKTLSLKFYEIWQNFYFYRILNNENFKMKVEQMNFVTHLIITALPDPDLEIRWGALLQTLR